MGKLLSQAALYAIRATWVDEIPRTHFDGCFLTRGHAGCAVARLLGHIDALTGLRRPQGDQVMTKPGRQLPLIVLADIEARVDQCKQKQGKTLTEWDREHLLEHIRYLQNQEGKANA